MKRLFIIGALVAIILIAFGVGWQVKRGNPSALWQIIQQQCVPGQQQRNDPAPCRKVDMTQRYAILQDKKGLYHFLLLPVDRISGIESPLLYRGQTPPYFALAWQNRQILRQAIGRPNSERFFSLVINPQYGRTQDQLHLHLACLRPEIYRALTEEAGQLTPQWQPLKHMLARHRYLARTLTRSDLVHNDPFQLLWQYVSQQNDDIGHYGLALAFSPSGVPILLTSRRSLIDWRTHFASELQDYDCTLAQPDT